MTMGNSEYHIPVLLHDSIDNLITDPSGIYVDVTFGGGGHSSEILNRISDNGRLVAFDQDADALDNLLEDERFIFVPQNFAFVKNNLRMHRMMPVEGLLADLGVSSHQFDTAERGFSFRFDAELDMRMDKKVALDAKKVLNEYDEVKLFEVFKLYGELKNARSIASRVVYKRADKPFRTIEDLKSALYNLAPRMKENRFFAQVFQALRIEVNQEMEVLKLLLEQMSDVIKVGGRIVFITYHSLEDRMVKNFVKTGNVAGVLEKDFYGNVLRPFKEVNRKPIISDEKELEANPRARSAKMRVAERYE
jgi:16S rRNA (cytosine1402-N4)-methyltransferase